MYKRNHIRQTSLKRNTATQGETLEHKVSRIVNNKEAIKDGAQKIYTERKDGVLPAYNIRTDRFEIAIDAMDKVAKTKLAQREERHKPKEGEEGKIIDINDKKSGDQKGTEGKA